MPVILSLETSTTVCSAALHKNGSLLASRELDTPQSAASQLTVQVSSLLEGANVPPEALSAVAVSSGPGSYTGLRIGAATAKGICYGLGIPLIAIDSLIVLAAALKSRPHDQLFCPMIDARRMEVYSCLLNDALQVIEPVHANIIGAGSFHDILEKQTIVFFGNGAAKCRDVIQHAHAVFLEDIHPSAVNMGPLAEECLTANQFVSLEDFEPNYLKDFVAKTKSTGRLL